MDFPFSVNNLLGETIAKLDCNVTPFRNHADGFDQRGLRKQLFQVIDRMGNASAKAQGLRTIITTGRKLELSDHILYVMRDGELNNGKGAVVGILKVGNKKLFVYDSRGLVHELDPICVLDFYVHESRQRMGCGRLLFDYMLKDLNIKPVHLAIDKPSFKFSSFLKKHYNLSAEVPQVNNFVVFEGFFNGRSDPNGRRGYSRPPSYPNSSYLGNDGDVILRRNRSSAMSYNSGLESNYRVSQHSSPRYKDYENQGADSHQLNMPTRAPSTQDIRERLLAGERDAQLDFRSPPSTNRSFGASASNLHRHNPTPTLDLHSKSKSAVDPRRLGNRGRDQNQNAADAGGRESPPLLQRDGPPNSYQEHMNLHQDYQGRNGHLKISNSRGPSSNSSLPSIQKNTNMVQVNGLQENGVVRDILGGIPWRSHVPSSQNWTIYDPPLNHQTIGSRHYTHTRLW